MAKSHLDNRKKGEKENEKTGYDVLKNKTDGNKFLL